MPRILIVLALILLPTLTVAHGGGLDANGGHKQDGSYHCHKEPCFTRQQVDKATTEAIVTKRVFSKTYVRSDWPHWSDFDGDCLNTRQELLKETSEVSITMTASGCTVKTGKWYDPFSGKTYKKASDLDIDHVIPLAWAHRHGGANWSTSKKEKFANDRQNLLVVDDGLNSSKSDQGPTEWMPPNHAYRCEYLAQWVLVMSEYPTLNMTSGEKRVFNKQLGSCA